MIRDPDALETTIAWVGLVLAVVLNLGIVAACIIAPLNGVWAPDIALGGWLGVCGIVYGIYRVVAWNHPGAG